MYHPSPQVNRKHTVITIDRSVSMNQDIWRKKYPFSTFHPAGL